MIASFFQRLEQCGVRYLLISGQATILYGAATFSEDVDIWVARQEQHPALRSGTARVPGALLQAHSTRALDTARG